jgi:hypothetical protein
MTDSLVHSFLSKTPNRPGNWPNAAMHVTPGAGAVLRIQNIRAVRDAECDTQALAAIDPALFDEFLDAVEAAGAAPSTLDQTYQRLMEKGQGRVVCFTADGASRATAAKFHAALQSRGWPLTLFINPLDVDQQAVPWQLALEALVAQTDNLSLGVRGKTYRGRCPSAEEKAELLNTLAPLLLAQPETAVRRAVFAVCSSDGVDLDRLAGDILTWAELKKLAANPLVTIGLLAPGCHQGGAASYDAVLKTFGEAADRLEAELGSRPKHFAFGAAWHGLVEQRDFEVVNSLGFTTACLPSGGALFAEDAAQFMIMPRVLLQNSPGALLDAQAMCGASLPVATPVSRKSSAA